MEQLLSKNWTLWVVHFSCYDHGFLPFFFFILVFGQKVMFPEQSTLINIHCPKVDIRDSLVSEGIGRPGENFYF